MAMGGDKIYDYLMSEEKWNEKDKIESNTNNNTTNNNIMTSLSPHLYVLSKEREEEDERPLQSV